jgi:exodeoxyribonuclease VII large subunit
MPASPSASARWNSSSGGSAKNSARLDGSPPNANAPLPLVPTRIAVITSRTGAALQDVINTARQRWPGARLALVDVRVQGEGAAAEITRAVRAAGQRGGFDVLLLTRGGGSAEDLWAFNDRELARAIVESPVPVVAAIGHETDTTIAELVADLRAATPTQAAMRIVPDAAALAREAANASRRLGLLCDRLLESARHRLRAVASHPLLADPGSLVAMGRARVREHHTGLTRVARARLGHDRLRLARALGKPPASPARGHLRPALGAAGAVLEAAGASRPRAGRRRPRTPRRPARPGRGGPRPPGRNHAEDLRAAPGRGRPGLGA